MGSHFKALELTDWKQYGRVAIEFHPKLTVLTGANGAGKTTILNLLARHFGWNINELATPYKKPDGGFRFVSWIKSWFAEPAHAPRQQDIGRLVYGDGRAAALRIPTADSLQYQVEIAGIQSVEGLSIPSHRPQFFYSQLAHISLGKRSLADAFSVSRGAYQNRVVNGGGASMNFVIKETLLSWAILGFGNAVVEADPIQMQYYKGFEGVLAMVLPASLGFESLAIRSSEVVLITKTGEFMLDAVSGGIAAIIDLAWQIYTSGAAPAHTPAKRVILIDEVENHLHPTMQREILPSLLKTFPNLQFVVSTHSPLVVGSVEDSYVYALRYQDRRVHTHRLDFVQKASAANDILREVLGVPVSMPLWAEQRLEEVVDRFRSAPMTQDTLAALRNELRALGFDHEIPTALARLLDRA